jgi:hypothetical protein
MRAAANEETTARPERSCWTWPEMIMNDHYPRPGWAYTRLTRSGENRDGAFHRR